MFGVRDARWISGRPISTCGKWKRKPIWSGWTTRRLGSKFNEGPYDEAISARYAFSFAIKGSVFGKVACALAKWEKVAGPADAIAVKVGEDGCFSMMVVSKMLFRIREGRKNSWKSFQSADIDDEIY